MSSHGVDINSRLNTPRVSNLPQPMQQIFLEDSRPTFSTKKERAMTRTMRAVPPKAPAKTCPSMSRFQRRREEKVPAKLVTFKAENVGASALCPLYDETREELYFSQCFTMVKQLGAGSFADVFKVRSRSDGKLYAVKVCRDSYRGATDRVKKIQEVCYHQQLPRHPNSVHFIKAWEEKGRLYMQTELCQTTLKELTATDHNISEARIWGYYIDLLQAVKHFHDHELLHLDIKPENILISFDDQCKLCDFGLVRGVGQKGRMESTKEFQSGDARYMAKETLDDKFSKAADIFSLGVTMLELAGDVDIPNTGCTWQMLRAGEIPEDLVKHRSPELLDVIRSMLKTEPQDRPDAASLLQSRSTRFWRRQHQRDQCHRLVAWFTRLWAALVGTRLWGTRLWSWWMNSSLNPYTRCSNSQVDPALVHAEGSHSSALSSSLDDAASVSSPGSFAHPGLTSKAPSYDGGSGSTIRTGSVNGDRRSSSGRARSISRSRVSQNGSAVLQRALSFTNVHTPSPSTTPTFPNGSMYGQASGGSGSRAVTRQLMRDPEADVLDYYHAQKKRCQTTGGRMSRPVARRLQDDVSTPTLPPPIMPWLNGEMGLRSPRQSLARQFRTAMDAEEEERCSPMPNSRSSGSSPASYLSLRNRNIKMPARADSIPPSVVQMTASPPIQKRNMTGRRTARGSAKKTDKLAVASTSQRPGQKYSLITPKVPTSTAGRKKFAFGADKDADVAPHVAPKNLLLHFDSVSREVTEDVEMKS